MLDDTPMTDAEREADQAALDAITDNLLLMASMSRDDMLCNNVNDQILPTGPVFQPTRFGQKQIVCTNVREYFGKVLELHGEDAQVPVQLTESAHLTQEDGQEFDIPPGTQVMMTARQALDSWKYLVPVQGIAA